MRANALALLVMPLAGAGLFALQPAAAVDSAVDPAIRMCVSEWPHPQTAAPSAPGKVEFSTQIQPILAARCTPCHFQGGKMYERLPFDQPKTIQTLGEKLFSRIKDENEQRLIREFLAQR